MKNMKNVISGQNAVSRFWMAQMLVRVALFLCLLSPVLLLEPAWADQSKASISKTGGPTPSQLLIDEWASTDFQAEVADLPTDRAECLSQKANWEWSVTSVQYKATANGTYANPTAAHTEEFHAATGRTTTLKTKFGAMGWWEVKIKVHGQYTAPAERLDPDPCGDSWSSNPDGEYTLVIYVQPVKVELNTASFGGAGKNALKTSGTTWADEGTGDVVVPEIRKKTGTGFGSNPETAAQYDYSEVCYSWDKQPELSATFNLSKNVPAPGIPATLKLSGTVGTSTLTFPDQAVTLSGTSATATFTATDKLAKQIYNGSIALKWEVKFDNQDSQSIASSSNTLFVTGGPPTGSTATVTRISKLTALCSGMSDEQAIVDKLWKNLISGATYLLLTNPPNVWALLDDKNITGECIHISTLFQKTYNVLGLSDGNFEVAFIYVGLNRTAHEATTTTAFTKRKCSIGESDHTQELGADHAQISDDELLVFQDKNRRGNHWEAAVKYTKQGATSSKYYPPGTDGAVLDNPQQVMALICRASYWIYVLNIQALDGPPCRPPTGPGPNPQEWWALR
jgi:hypothetical protein